MNTRLEGPARAATQGPDERGAIMLVGIFMCACLVGLMWYVAGIGDALVFRERVQEAADAGAFSGAALHARGMNLIVLLNLVMACILGIRVALKAVQLTLVILAAVFAILGIFVQSLLTIAGLCLDAAAEMQTLISELKNPIDQALKALSKAEVGIARAVPFAACAGGKMVADRFGAPISTSFVGISVDTVKTGLPLQEGTADRLCYEAGKSVGSLMGWLLGKVGVPGLGSGVAGEKFGKVMGTIASSGGPYFCEMGSGGPPPNFDGILSDNADEACNKERDKYVKEFNEANGAWQNKCTDLKIICIEQDEWGQDNPYMSDTGGLTPTQRTDVSKLLEERIAKKEQLDSFDFGKCKNEKVSTMRKKIQEGMGPSTSSGSGNDMTPKMVIPSWSNGIDNTQVMSWVDSNTGYLRFGTQGVKVGKQQQTAHEATIPIAAGFGFAQAEYFYDCQGKWGGEDCNGDRDRKDNEGAMWHFRWRARLHRYSSPYNDLSTLIELPTMAPAHGAWVARAAQANPLSFSSMGNMHLKSQLLRFANPADQKTVAIH